VLTVGAISALTQSAVRFFDKVLDSDVSSNFATIAIMVIFDTQMRAETVAPDDLGCLPFGQQIDLQVEVIPAIYDSTHSVLLDQHKCRQQHRVQRDECR
jgi:adenylate kinase